MPTIQVEFSEEEYQQLSEWAREQGQPVDAWLREVLRAAAQRRAHAIDHQKAFQTWVQRHASDDAPPLPLETLRRENLYREFGL